MHFILIFAKAVGLIVLAGLFFFGFQAALGAEVVGVSQQALCAGQPITGCFLTII